VCLIHIGFKIGQGPSTALTFLYVVNDFLVEKQNKLLWMDFEQEAMPILLSWLECIDASTEEYTVLYRWVTHQYYTIDMEFIIDSILSI